MDKDALDLDRLESLARAATPGPWHWVDWDTDLPCLPDAPCSAGEHDRHAYSFSLRTVDEFPTAHVGPLPKFIISSAEEFHEVKQDDGTWTHPDAEFIAASSPEVVLALISAARLGANGYVVVPRHLLDELVAAADPGESAPQTGHRLDAKRLRAARAAVVEAVGPTREDK